jgi:ubiquinone/menaquinone biosynthesis C-methylase UbiE
MHPTTMLQFAAPAAQPYVLGHAPREQERLTRQGGYLRPITERVLRDAGIVPGMRVLDVGCGTGQVSALAAELVGPGGLVVGIDRAPAVLDTAARHLRALGLDNARFVSADAARVTLGELAPGAHPAPFDAVVGRFVLMYVADAGAVLRHLSTLVRPGGVLAFAELLALPALEWPPRPVYARCMEWLRAALRAGGAYPDMGLRLADAFAAAGLPPAAVRLDGVPMTGAAADRLAWVAETLRTLMPAAEQHGIATAAEADVDTLAPRLCAEAAATGGTVCGCVLGSVWAHAPAAG